MQQKTYSQMRQEFVQFYQNEVKQKLPAYHRMRRLEGPMQLAFFGFFASFLMTFAFLIWYQFLKPIISGFFPQFSFFDSIIKILLYIDIAVAVISITALLLLSTVPSKNKRGNTRYIQRDLEMELKKDLMPKFVKIFFDNGQWYKKSLYNYHRYNNIQTIDNVSRINSALDECVKTYNAEKNQLSKFKISNLRELKLLNPYPWERYDDIIKGSYCGVNIRVLELNTKIISFEEFLVLLFLLIWLTCFTGAGILLFLLVLSPFIILLLLISSFKIYQYSKFQGVVIEFDMNKNFKGHTFFHENSITAKKIPFDKNVYQDVKLESSSFEHKYSVYSDDQIEARYILTPSMIERIENLKSIFKAKYVRGSFKDNKLILAVHTGKDMFAMGNDFKDSNSQTFEILYDEIISILKIVDELKLNEHIGL